MSSPLSSRHMLSKSEKRKLIALLKAKLPQAVELLEKVDRVEVARLRVFEADLIIVEGVPAIVAKEDLVYPTVLAAHKLELKLPLVVVDMGAVPHILSGADVMAPGIVEVDQFGKSACVYIADLEKRRVFAVGLSLMSSEEIKSVKRGKAVRNLHYAGDKLWNVITNL